LGPTHLAASLDPFALRLRRRRFGGRDAGVGAGHRWWRRRDGHNDEHASSDDLTSSDEHGSSDDPTSRDEHGFAAWLSGFDEIDVEVHHLGIHADSQVAFAHSLNRLTGRRSGGAGVDIWMRSTLGFRREAKGWRIAHAHTSVPFYSGLEPKAALDLKP